MKDGTTEKPKCQKRVYSGQRSDMHGHTCGRPARVKEQDKWLCAIHCADAEKKRKEKRESEYQAKREADRKRYAQQNEWKRRAEVYEQLVSALENILSLWHSGKQNVDAYVDAEKLLSEVRAKERETT